MGRAAQPRWRYVSPTRRRARSVSHPAWETASLVEPEAERRAGRGILDPHSASVRLDDQLTECQTEPVVRTCCTRLELRKALEHPLAQPWRYAWPAIDDPKLGAAVSLCRDDVNLRPFGRVANRVLHQVLDHPTQQLA